MNFFIGKFLQVLYFPCAAVVKTENLQERFLRSYESEIMIQFLFKSCVGNETCLKKSTEVSNYGKFICNIFGWGTVEIVIIRAKVQFNLWI